MGRAARHLEGKAILYADKMTDSMRRAIDENLPQSGVRARRITAGARCIEVLRLPTDAGGAFDPQHRVVGLDGNGARYEVLGSRPVHQCRVQMQHDAGFHRAAVNAVTQLHGVEEIRHLGDAVPRAVHRQHPQAHAQLAADDVDELRLAAVGVEENDAPAAGTG